MGRLLPRGNSPPFSGVNRPKKSLPLPLTNESVAAVPPPSSHHVEAYPTQNKKPPHSDGGAGGGDKLEDSACDGERFSLASMAVGTPQSVCQCSSESELDVL